MSQKPPAHYPITGVCVVADPMKCPPHYELLLRSADRKDDCDLWGESLIRRTSRFLCFSRDTQITQGRNNVLTGIMILNEKETPNPGYTALDRTFDTSEKSLKKKQIAIMMASRDTTTDAICDIVFQSKTKRAPDGFTLVGEINGLYLCYKVGKVPVETQSFSHASPANSTQHPVRPAPLPPIPPAKSNTVPGKPPVAAPRVLNKQESKLAINPLADVTFQLNMKHRDLSSLKTRLVPEISFRSIVDIQNEYDYSFTLERSALGQRA
jgi:ESCRT-I complex subunit MVB12